MIEDVDEFNLFKVGSKKSKNDKSTKKKKKNNDSDEEPTLRIFKSSFLIKF